MNQDPSVVVIGGGTGTYTLLSALRDKPVHLTALLTMVDDGGSNKVLRDEFGLLPTSGVRQAIVALSRNRSLLRELFMYRFHQGSGTTGMTFGNLFLAAMTDMVGTQEKAIEETCKLLSVKGDILPISYDDVRLVAKYSDGREVVGEHAIDEPEAGSQATIVDVWTDPKATISEKARTAILNADSILLGPGDFYTNTVPDLIVEGVCDAIMQSHAKVIFIVNLMTKFGDSQGYTAKTFIEKLSKYIPVSRLSAIVINNDIDFSQDVIEAYTHEGAEPIKDDLDELGLPATVSIIRAPVVSHQEAPSVKADALKRSVIRHDQHKLGSVLEKILL